MVDCTQMMLIIQIRIVYTENKHCENLDKAGLVGKNRLQGESDYKEGGIWYGFFLVSKIKDCLTIGKFGITDEHKTLRSLTNMSDNLDRKEIFYIPDGGKLLAKVPLSWKNSFSQGVVIPHKMRNCTDCKKILCEDCDNLLNEKKRILSQSK